MTEEEQQATDNTVPSHAWRSADVHKVELEQYIKKRRAANGIVEPATPDNLAGLCISGGGVRSATLGLGMLQALIKAKKLKYFDYLSTVSGGGYIGSCLSSLLSAEPQRRDKEWQNRDGDKIENHNIKFDVSKVGLDEDNSLLTNESYEYPPLGTGTLTTKQQLIHLRQHGEYLTPHKSIKDWDVHRLLGALFGGIVTNVSTFLLLLATVVLLHHVLLAFMSGEAFIDTLQQPQSYLNQRLYGIYQADSLAYIQDSLESVSNGRKFSETAPVFEKRHTIREVYPDSVWAKLSASAQLSAWAAHRFSPQMELVWTGIREHWDLALFFGLMGVVAAIIFIMWARYLPPKISRREQEEQEYTGAPPHNKLYYRGGEEDMLDLMEKPLIKWFYHLGLWGIPLAAYIFTAYMTWQTNGSYNFYVMLALPFCYSIGLFLGLHMLIFLYFINNGTERVSGYLYRSFYTGMQGGALLLMILTMLFPIAIVLLLGNHGLAVRLSGSFVPVIAAYYFTMQSFGGRVTGNGVITNILHKLQNPLLNLSIFLFVGLAFAWISQGLLTFEKNIWDDWTPFHAFCATWSKTAVIGAMFLISLTGLILMGLAVNSNDVSLHYFYRDRLSEAYLRTSGRVAVKRPGMPTENGDRLLRVNLRNHVDLQLRHIGEGSFKAPYHIIVTALNLQGSHDLSAKTQKSEHFIFSKYFVGSRSTGYASTNEYNYGTTKLSTAMTISAAAVSSGMGPLSFAASNFYMTLFNLRTGYWIDNPKHFIYMKQRAERAKKAREAKKLPQDGSKPAHNWSLWHDIKLHWTKWTTKYPLWLLYTWRELTGNLSSDTRKVYVSDGGHTGDNLGLLPLIQRKCSTIVIADFEEDSTFSFESFSQAIRLAKSIYNTDICIDLSEIIPKKSDSGAVFSPSSIAEGTITYHFTESVPNAQTGVLEEKRTQKIGRLVYMKSSVSLLREAAEVYDESAAPPPVLEPAPVFVLNYFKRNPHFPHQSTADQYFDEVQFEAYRMLGEHIGKQAAQKIVFEPLKA